MGQDSFQTVREQYAGNGGVREAFSTKVSDYVTARPGYPTGLYEKLRSSGAMLERATVADVGAGTGLLSRGLLEWGCSVIAVEPNAEMRAAADEILRDCPGYRSVAGGAENTLLETGSVDLVTAAQAFHWFDPDATRREWLRILKPSGQVAIIWNDRLESDPLQKGLEGIFNEFGGAKHEARSAYDHKARLETFFHGGEMHEWAFTHEHRLVRAAFHSLTFSRSYMPTFHSEEGSKVRERVDALFDEWSEGDSVVVRYRTEAYVGRLGSGMGE